MISFVHRICNKGTDISSETPIPSVTKTFLQVTSMQKQAVSKRFSHQIP